MVKHPKMMIKFKNSGIFKACLVTYPSIIPAQMVNGMVLKNILNESFNPIFKDSNLDSVFGKRMDVPKINPHIASTTIAKISKTPCNHIPLALSFKAP